MTRPICLWCARAIPKRTTWRTISRSATPRFSKAECRALTNLDITSMSYWPDGTVQGFHTWDGESYIDPYFCTKSCAADFGHAAAEAGYRKETP